MLITIFASIWAQNLWDELILKNEIKILKEKYIEQKPKFIVFSYDYKNPFYVNMDIEYREFFPIGISEKRNLFKNIKNFFSLILILFKTHLVVIWWGWLFFDNEVWNKKNPLDLWIFRKKIFNFFFKKIYFFRIGLSIKKEDSFLKIKKIFSWKKHIVEVRDNYSLNVLNDLWISWKKEYDPVFFDNWELNINKKVSIKSIFKNFWIKDIENINFNEKKVGIAFRSWYLTKNPNPELEILLIKEIIEFIQNKWWNVVLLPHSFHEKDILSNDFKWMELIQSKTKKVWISRTMKETYNFYSEKKVDIVLAQRLHSIILSQVYEIPFIWISYSRKTKEILRDLK